MNGAPRTERMSDAEAVRLVLAAQQHEQQALDLLPPGSDQSRGLRVEAARRTATGEAARLFARADALYWRIILGYDAFLIRIAKYSRHDARRGVEEEDIYQTCRLGAYRALSRFEPGRGTTVRSWVAWWARAALLTCVDRAGDVQTGRHTPVSARVWALRLDAPPYADRPELRLIDLLASSGPFPDDAADDAIRGERIRAALDALHPRHAAIFLRYVSGEDQAMIAASEGTSRQRIGQICDMSRQRIADHIHGKDTPEAARAVAALKWLS